MKNEDYATEERKDFLHRQALHDEKIERAKRQLGTKYLLHPVNQVQKRAEPKASPDMTVTFKAAP